VQTWVGRVLSDLTTLFLLLLVARAVVDLLLSLNRGFRPTGAGAAALEVVYTVTDPPLRLLRRLIPPLRIGNVALDLGFLLLFVALGILQRTVFSSI